MGQVPLNLHPVLAYHPKDFFLHSGVQEAAKLSQQLILESKPRVLLISGAKRSGKTHFSVWLADWAASQSRFPKLIEISQIGALSVGPKEVIIIDDFDRYLLTYQDKAGPGPLVALLESARHAGAQVFGLIGNENYSLEPHVGSRLASAITVAIDNPEESEISELFSYMAKQRGIKLGNQKKKFAERRLRRDIPSIERYLDRVMLLSHRMGRKLELGMLKSAILSD